MTSHGYRREGQGGPYQHSSHSTQPPAYNAAIRFDGGGSTSHYRQGSGIPTNAFDSSRAVANERTGDRYGYEEDDVGNGAGIGAGRNAYMAPDTPSMYTDPYEYASTVAGPAAQMGAGMGTANVMGTRPDPNFLEHDPYPSQAYHAQLDRSNTIGTLGPADSISAHNLDARSRDLGTFDTDPGYQGYDDYHNGDYRASRISHDYHTSNGGHDHFDASRASLPLKDGAAYMGYADDEEDEKRQRDHYWNGDSKDDWDRRHPPSLFANAVQGPAVPRKSVEEHEDDRRGLLAALSGNGVKAGWGGSLEEQIQRRQKGIGRQRWPILSWILSVVYIIVFIIELIKAKSETGQAIQTKPSVNPMIGPPFEFLISFGARFVPCMRKVPDVPLTTPLVCLKDVAKSSVPSDQTCPLYEICGLPNANTYGQAYRFVTPMFLHAGFVRE